MRLVRVSVVAVVSLFLSLAFVDAGFAISSDAVVKCKATAVQEGVGADVPESEVFEYFGTVPADDGSAEEVLCGDGRVWGAVHIEVKHRVADWSVTRECMSKVTSRVRPAVDSGKRTWDYSWTPGRSAIVVAGDNGVITSFPWDSGSEESWLECAQS